MHRVDRTHTFERRRCNQQSKRSISQERRRNIDGTLLECNETMKSIAVNIVIIIVIARLGSKKLFCHISSRAAFPRCWCCRWVFGITKPWEQSALKAYLEKCERQLCDMCFEPPIHIRIHILCPPITWRNKVTLFRKESGFISITWRNKVTLFRKESGYISIIYTYVHLYMCDEHTIWNIGDIGEYRRCRGRVPGEWPA